jgi:hypothetical protein
VFVERLDSLTDARAVRALGHARSESGER